MADQLDGQYAYLDPAIAAREKHNTLTPSVQFRQQIAADANFQVIGIRTSIAFNATQRRQLETAIAAINGVAGAKVLVFGVTPPAADVPAGHHIDAVGELRFRINLDV